MSDNRENQMFLSDIWSNRHKKDVLWLQELKQTVVCTKTSLFI